MEIETGAAWGEFVLESVVVSVEGGTMLEEVRGLCLLKAAERVGVGFAKYYCFHCELLGARSG